MQPSGDRGVCFNGRVRRQPLLILVGTLLVALIGGGWWYYDQATRPQNVVEAMVRNAVANLGVLTIAPDSWTAAKGVDPQADLTAIVKGMGGRKPVLNVTVTDVSEEQKTGSATLAWAWHLRDGDPDWSYTTSLPLQLTENGWRLVWSPTVVQGSLKSVERLSVTALAAARGEIVGANDVRLAYTQPANRVGIDKSLVDAATAEAAAQQLATLLGQDAGAFVARVKAAGSKAFVEAITLRVEDDVQHALSDQAATIKGVRLILVQRSLGLTSSFARPILGTVGEATQELVDGSNGAIKAGDQTGLSGLQLSRNSVLTGKPGLAVQAVGRTNAGLVRDLFRIEPVTGTTVHISLNRDVQQAAEAVLAEVPGAAGLVAIRPSDGALLAIASGPGSGGLSTASLGQAPPGSTFKTVTSLALIRTGATPDTPVSCTPNAVVDGYRFDNFQGYPTSALGNVSLRTAFANSCNTAMINQRDRLSQAQLVQAAEALGLTADVPLGIPAFLGSMATKATGTDHAAAMIGQGADLASPLGMATVAASIAKGSVVRPRLIMDGAAPAVPDPAVPLNGDEADAIRTLMRAAVTEGGAGILARAPGQPVYAKTGTASYGNPVQYHGWMIAIRGDLAVAVFAANAKSGATTAGPVMLDLLNRI
ncbi:MAG TPA: penicillin-binding protein [Propionibacteriaceae bacterium]|nr:penicillin-binding protein [Propionibacteriaceae bacterium]HBY23475.1 penicillin-binding protein [Propionibacteriaceae bacterium]